MKKHPDLAERMARGQPEDIGGHLDTSAQVSKIVSRAPGWLRLAGRSYVRKVPHRGTVRTRPSAARARSTRVTVAWETW